MSAERLVASHLRLAAEALSAARALLEFGNRYAVYQAEQAVEQMILALAQSENVAFTRAQQHQLDTMRRALPEANTFRPTLSTMTWLEAYATTYRYPKTMGGLADPPDRDKLSATITAATVLLTHLAKHFEVDLDPRSKLAAANAHPPRA